MPLLRRIRRSWRSRRITSLLPRLMEEFYADGDPMEVLGCADAVVTYYEERTVCSPSLSLARRRTRECLRAGTCKGMVSQ